MAVEASRDELPEVEHEQESEVTNPDLKRTANDYVTGVVQSLESGT